MKTPRQTIVDAWYWALLEQAESRPSPRRAPPTPTNADSELRRIVREEIERARPRPPSPSAWGGLF